MVSPTKGTYVVTLSRPYPRQLGQHAVLTLPQGLVLPLATCHRAHVPPRGGYAAALKFRNPWPGLEAPLMALADHELIDAGRVEVGDFGFDLTEVDDLTFSR